MHQARARAAGLIIFLTLSHMTQLLNFKPSKDKFKEEDSGALQKILELLTAQGYTLTYLQTKIENLDDNIKMLRANNNSSSSNADHKKTKYDGALREALVKEFESKKYPEEYENLEDLFVEMGASKKFKHNMSELELRDLSKTDQSLVTTKLNELRSERGGAIRGLIKQALPGLDTTLAEKVLSSRRNLTSDEKKQWIDTMNKIYMSERKEQKGKDVEPGSEDDLLDFMLEKTSAKYGQGDSNRAFLRVTLDNYVKGLYTEWNKTHSAYRALKSLFSSADKQAVLNEEVDDGNEERLTKKEKPVKSTKKGGKEDVETTKKSGKEDAATKGREGKKAKPQAQDSAEEIESEDSKEEEKESEESANETDDESANIQKKQEEKKSRKRKNLDEPQKPKKKTTTDKKEDKKDNKNKKSVRNNTKKSPAKRKKNADLSE